MSIIEKLLTDNEILDRYKSIDKVNPYPFNHGIKHINNVVALADKIAPLFNLTQREVEILKTCEILHDLGQVDGREKHGLKAANFARNYLPSLNYFSSEELSQIYSAIETHDEKKDYSLLQNKFSWLVNLIDKMDFAKDRLEDDYLENFDYIEYNDIETLSFEKEGSVFKIKIHTIENPKLISEECLFNRSFFNKVVNTSMQFCNYFGLTLEIYLDEKKLNLNNLNIGRINR